MTTPVPKHPSQFSLASVRTGAPVNTAAMSRLAEDMAYLNGSAVQEAGGAIVWPRPSGRVQLASQDYTVALSYVPSRMGRALKVSVELYPASLDITNPAQTSKVTVALPTGAAWIDANGLDGSEDLEAPPPGRITYGVRTAWVDVSGMTPGTLAWFLVSVTRVSSPASPGLARVYLADAPLADLDPVGDPATEYGLNGAGALAGKRLEDGGASADFGLERVWTCLDAARTGWFKVFQLAGLEGADPEGPAATPYWYVSGSSWDPVDFLHWTPPGSPRSVQWYIQPRIMAAATGASWDWVVRYRTMDTPGVTTTPQVRLLWQSSLSSGNSGAVTLTPSTSWTTLTQAVSLPGIADPDDVIQVWMEGNADGGTINFSNVSLVERLA